MHLLGADIVDGDDEDGLVLLEQALELVEVAGLVLAAPHIFFCTEGRLFKGSVFGYRGLRGGWICCGGIVTRAKFRFLLPPPKCVLEWLAPA